MADLDRELNRTVTQQKLFEIRVVSQRKFKRLNTDLRKRVLYWSSLIPDTTNIDKLDDIADQIQGILHLKHSPLDFAWSRKYNAMFGYKFCLKLAWRFLYDQTKNNTQRN